MIMNEIDWIFIQIEWKILFLRVHIRIFEKDRFSLRRGNGENFSLSLSLFAWARSVSGPFLEINVISGCNVLREENGEGEGYGAEDVSPVIRR